MDGEERFETSYGVEVAENELIDAPVPNCKKVVAGSCGVVTPLSIYLVEFAETANPPPLQRTPPITWPGSIVTIGQGLILQVALHDRHSS
ncbi:hypothetical protein pipiens_010011 [Culex pipiens pipiens]|uniref:Uncharacterized protein n=1 Tax=Culex pipiens pipiens TaxID=38569 RepID=A0ABD1DCC8_CULPP